jgi:hypothetical protein
LPKNIRGRIPCHPVRSPLTKYQFNPERLAYWYLRLGAFLTIENFIVHDEAGGFQRTDVDLVAVRFPNRRETFAKPDKIASVVGPKRIPIIMARRGI